MVWKRSSVSSYAVSVLAYPCAWCKNCFYLQHISLVLGGSLRDEYSCWRLLPINTSYPKRPFLYGKSGVVILIMEMQRTSWNLKKSKNSRIV